jgi:hypothetical protein
MKWILLLLSCLLFCNCDLKRGDPIPYSEKERLADEVLANAAIKLRNEKGLVLCGTSGGMLGQIRMLALSFDYRNPVTIQKGRELLIAAVQTLLAETNHNEKIRPYLQNYPFDPTNVEIRIFLRNDDGSGLGENTLRVIAAAEGILSYYIEVPDKNFGHFKTIHKETYEEALQELERLRSN